MGNKMSIVYSAADTMLTDIVEVNSSFATGKLKAMYTGENRNGSNIPDKAVIDAIPSIFNIPIVAHYMREENEIGGHDMQVVKTDNGGLKLVNLTEPCGVVTDHTKVYIERSADENGVEHDYLVLDGVVLWRRQEVVQHIIEDCGGVVSHSMEIDVTEGGTNKETGYFDIDKFEFQALCLLGNCEPCFEGSNLALYSSASNFKEKMEQMMNELKDSYFSIAGNSNTEKGGQEMNEELTTTNESEKKFSAEAEENAAGESTAEADTAATEDAAEQAEGSTDGDTVRADESQDGTEAEQNADGTTANFALASNVEEQLYMELGKVTHVNTWGDEMRRYQMCDYDAEKSEVYCFDRKEQKLFAFAYTTSGDAIAINYDSARRVKVAYVDFEDGDAATGINAFSAEADMLEKVSKFSKENGELSTQLAAANEELVTLRAFKADTEKAAADSARKNVLAKFASIADNEDFCALAEKASEYAPEVLEEKCYAIIGRLNTTQPQAATSKFSFEDDTDHDGGADKPYGGIVERYRKH